MPWNKFNEGLRDLHCENYQISKREDMKKQRNLVEKKEVRERNFPPADPLPKQ